MSFADKPLVVSKSGVRKPNLHILVFTEDAKSSKTFLEYCAAKSIGDIHLQVIGKGKHTTELVKEAVASMPKLTSVLAKRIESASKYDKTKVEKCNAKSKKAKSKQITYDQVWLVFDKDDFDDFDKAIKVAQKNGFKEAWSNECFELWYYLYTHTLDAAELKNGVPRDTIFDYLTSTYKLQEKFGRKYRKLKGAAGNEFHKEMAENLNLMKNAYSRAKELENKMSLKTKALNKRNPYTLIHNLIAMLIPEVAKR